MLEASSLDVGVEVIANFALVAGIKLSAEEHRDLIGLHGVHGGADQRVLVGGEISRLAEHDIGREFELHTLQ